MGFPPFYFCNLLLAAAEHEEGADAEELKKKLEEAGAKVTMK